MHFQKGKPDLCLFVLVMMLMILGLAVLYSSSAYNGQVRFDDPAYYFKKQLFAAALGLFAMVGIASLDYHALSPVRPSGLSFVSSSLRRGASLWGRLQRFQEMAVPRPSFLSAGGICQTGSHPFSRGDGLPSAKSKKRGSHGGRSGNGPSHRGAGGNQQPQHRCDYSGNRRCHDFYFQSKISAFSLDSSPGLRISGNLSWPGAVPPGAPGDLAPSGAL